MPIYKVETPDGNILKIEGPEGATDDQLLGFAAQQYYGQQPEEEIAPAPAKTKKAEDVGYLEGAGAALRRGISSFGDIGAGLGLAAESVAGTPEEARRKMQAIKAEQQKAEAVPGTKFEDLKRLYAEKGVGAALGELPKYATEQILQSAPQMATPLAAAAAASPFVTPVGGALVGMGTYALQQFGNFLVRQAVEKDDPKELEVSKAALTAAGTAPIGYFADRFTFGLGSVGKQAGKEIMEELAARTATGAVTNALGKVGKGVAAGVIAEAPTEVLEQAAERYQAGLDLTGEQAMREYEEAFFGAAAAGGGIKGVSTAVGLMRSPRQEAGPEVVPPVEPTPQVVTPEGAVPEAPGMTEAAREAELIRELERQREAQYEQEAPPVEQPAAEAPVAPTAPEAPVVQPEAPVAEAPAIEPVAEPQAPSAVPIAESPISQPITEAPAVEPVQEPTVPEPEVAQSIAATNQVMGILQSAAEGFTIGSTQFAETGDKSTLNQVRKYLRDNLTPLMGRDDANAYIRYLVDEGGLNEADYGSNNELFGVAVNGIKIPEVTIGEQPVKAEPLPETVHPLEAREIPGQEEVYREASRKAEEAGIDTIIQNGKINPELTTVSWDEVSKFPTLGGLLKHVQPHVPVDYAEIIKKILPSVQNIPLNVVQRISGAPRALGAYRPAISKLTGDVVQHRIELSKSQNGNDISTIVHEALHGATVSNYYRGKKGNEKYAQAAKDLDSLTRRLFKMVNEGKANLPFMLDYKRPNLSRELISWGQTDRQVQAELKKIVMPNKKTAWSEFVTTMRKLLGLPANQTTALDKLLDISERLTSQQDVLIRRPAAEAVEEIDTLTKERPAEGYPSPRATALGGNLTVEPWKIEPLSDKTYWQRFLDNKVYEYVDKFVDLRQIIKAINASSKKLDERWNASMRENLYHKRVDHEISDFQEKEIKPLAQEMVARGVSEAELNNYLLARHAEERNIAINERNDRPDLQDRGSGVHSMVARAYMRGASPQEVAALRKIMTQNKAEETNITFNKNEEGLLADLAKMTPAKRKALQELSKRVDAIIKKTQDKAVEGGLEKSVTVDGKTTSPTIDYWRDKYPNYAPLKRDPDEMDFVDTSSGIGKGFGARAGITKAATGSLKTVDNILMNIMLERDLVITKAEKARIGRALLAMFLEHPNPNFVLPINPNAAIIGKTNDLGFEIATLDKKLSAERDAAESKRLRGELLSDEDLKRIQDMSEELARKKARYKEMAAQSEAVKKQMEQELESMGLDPELVSNVIRAPQGAFYNPQTGKVEYRTNDYLLRSKNVFPVAVNGETRYLIFNPGDERAARLVQSLKGADVEQLGQITSLMGKFTRWISLVNTQYNPFFGIVNMIRDVQGAQFNLSTTALAGQQMAVNRHIYSAARSIYRTLRSGEPTGEFGRDWIELQERGGTTGAKDMIVDQQKKLSVLQKELADLQRNPTDAALRKSAKAVFGWMSDFNDTMENAVRLSAFVEAKKKFAKMYPNNPDLAVDKAAELAKNLTVNFNRKGAKTKFVNSWYAFFNAAVQGSARMYETLSGPAGKKIMGSLVALGVMQQLILSAAGFDENDPPEFVREKNLVIPTGGGQYLSWPMPLGFNFFVNFGRILTSSVETGGKNIAKDMSNMLGAAADTFSPVGGGTLSQAVTPTPFDPYFAVQQNVDQFGRPIYREDRPGRPSPGYLRSTEGATAFSKGLAEILNYVSGGTEFQKGKISPTADEIDYYAGQIGGGSYREARKVVEYAKNIASGEETAPYRVPVAGRFFGDTGSETNVRNKFYENVQRLAGYEEEIKGRASKGQDVGEFLKEHPDARYYKAADSVYNEVSKINKMRKQLIERGASQDELKRLNDVKLQLMKQFNESYEQARPK